MYPNSWWQFGGGGTGSPIPGLPPIGGGYPTTGGAAPPWWVGAGIYLGQETGFFDWLGETVFGEGDEQSAYPGSGTYGAPTVAGMPLDYVSNSLAPTLQAGEANRQRALQSYQDNPSLIQRFVSWLQSMGALASLVQRLTTSTIFDWPIIIQDLILLFFHDEPAAVELGPAVVGEANKQVGGQLPTYGGFGGALAHFSPPIMAAQPKLVYQAPKGYVTVTDPMTGAKAFMLKAVARSMGLYKPRATAPIKARDWKAAKAAQRIEKKIARMLQGSCNFKVTKKR